MRWSSQQCRSCPRNCKRLADDHLIPLGSFDPGKVVRGRDPRARKPATGHGHARTRRAGCSERWKAGAGLPHEGRRADFAANAGDGLFVRRRITPCLLYFHRTSHHVARSRAFTPLISSQHCALRRRIAARHRADVRRCRLHRRITSSSIRSPSRRRRRQQRDARPVMTRKPSPSGPSARRATAAKPLPPTQPVTARRPTDATGQHTGRSHTAQRQSGCDQRKPAWADRA